VPAATEVFLLFVPFDVGFALYFESVGFNLHGFNLHEIGTESVRKLCLLRRLADPLLSPFFRVLRVFRG